MAILSDEFYYQPIRIDTINTRVFADLVAKEGDANGRGLLLTLTENGLMKDTTGITLILKWEHTSVGNQGLDNFEAVDLSKGLYKITYPTEMLNRGKARAFIQIIDSGKLAGTRNIEITVDRGVGDDTAIASSDSFTALAQALIDVTNLESTYAPELLSVKQQLADKATKDELSQELLSLGSQLADIDSRVDLLNRGLGETFATLTDLQTAYPTGDTKDHIVGADGHRYYWNDTAWADGGAYQAVEIQDESVTIFKLDQRVQAQLGEYGTQLLVDSTERKRYDVNTLELLADNSFAMFNPVACAYNDMFVVGGLVAGVVMYLDSQHVPISVAYAFSGDQTMDELLIVNEPTASFLGVTNYWGTKDYASLKKYDVFDISAIAEQKSVVDDLLKLDVKSVAVNPVILWNNSNGTYTREVVEDGISLTISNTSLDSDYIIQFGDFLNVSEQRPAYFALEYTVTSVSGKVTMYDSNNSAEPLFCTLGAHDYLYESTVALTKYQIQITIPVGATIALTINHMHLIYQTSDENNAQLTNDLVQYVIDKSGWVVGTHFITKSRTSLYSDTAKYADVAGKIDNKWEGKVFVSYGDSNTQNGGWQDHLVNKLGLIHINKGLGGTNASGADAIAGWQDVRIDSFPPVVDVVTIMFGTNDWSNVYPIGTDNGDTTTFMGAYGVIVKKIQTKYPNARLVLVSPPFRTNSLWTAEPPVIPFDTGDDKDMKKYIEAVEYIAFKYGCKFVNAWAGMGVNEFNFKQFLKEEPWPVHLDQAGKNRLGEVLIGAFREIEPVV